MNEASERLLVQIRSAIADKTFGDRRLLMMTKSMCADFTLDLLDKEGFEVCFNYLVKGLKRRGLPLRLWLPTLIPFLNVNKIQYQDFTKFADVFVNQVSYKIHPVLIPHPNDDILGTSIAFDNIKVYNDDFESDDSFLCPLIVAKNSGNEFYTLETNYVIPTNDSLFGNGVKTSSLIKKLNIEHDFILLNAYNYIFWRKIVAVSNCQAILKRISNGHTTKVGWTNEFPMPSSMVVNERYYGPTGEIHPMYASPL